MKKSILLSLLLALAILFTINCDTGGGSGGSATDSTNVTDTTDNTSTTDETTTTPTQDGGTISVSYGANNTSYVVGNNSTYDFKLSSLQEVKMVTFTIKNDNMLKDLTLNGKPTISGTHATEFAVNDDTLTLLLKPYETTSFTVSLTPISLGAKSATLNISSNDPLKSVITINLKGTGSTVRTVASGSYIGFGTYNSIAVDGNGIIYLAYTASTSSTISSLKVAKSTDGGLQWITTTVDDISKVGEYNSIAVNGNNIYISYTDATNYDLKFAKSINAGESYTTMIIPDGGFLFTDICVKPDEIDGDDIYIASGGDVLLSESNDGGTTWSTWEMTGGTTSSSDSIFSVSFTRNTDGKLFYAFWNYTDASFVMMDSIDNGINWHSVQPSTTQLGDNADIAVGPGNVVYSICQYKPSYELIFYKSTDGGANWTTGKVIAEKNYSSSLAVDTNGNIYVANKETSGLSLIKSTDGGATWQTYTIDSDSLSGSIKLFIDNSNVLYVSYHGNSNVKFAKSIDGGITW